MQVISKKDFDNFVSLLINDDSLNVVGVKSKGNKFAFGTLESANEVRLDYDVPLLPPKKYFFPQRETLVTYNFVNGFTAKDPAVLKSTIIIGVHPYDIAALLDKDGIAVRSGHHCAMPLHVRLGVPEGSSRASFYIYNSMDDANTFIDSMKKINDIFR